MPAHTIKWIGPAKSSIHGVPETVPERTAHPTRGMRVIGLQPECRSPYGARHQDVHLKPSGMCMGADKGVQPGSNRKPGIGYIQEQADRLRDPRAKTRVAAVEIIDAHIGIHEGERGGVVAVPVWQCVQNRQHQAGPPNQ